MKTTNFSSYSRLIPGSISFSRIELAVLRLKEIIITPLTLTIRANRFDACGPGRIIYKTSASVKRSGISQFIINLDKPY
ncbi:MAG: hypothetical protein K0R59_120 [Sphingobacterium sp.]|jgi:hypothetical protein|nr:hypothetical protein [Sphingobacterium sp.]